ncbi:ribonuclease H-like domain-containing protein [Tanacetum coccineum]
MFVFCRSLYMVLSRLLGPGSSNAYLLIYVDDVILTASSTLLLQEITSSLYQEFSMTDLGVLLSILHLLIPIFPIKYNRFLYMHDPREPHLAALNRILRYVRGILDYGFQLYSSSGSLVTLSRSSAEAEYHDVANVVAEIAWLRNLLRELHSPLKTTTLVYCDNINVVYLSSKPVQNQRTKHIEIDIHFVRDEVVVGHVSVLHVPWRYQFENIFTKGLLYVLFDDFRSSLSVRPSLTLTAGAMAGKNRYKVIRGKPTSRVSILMLLTPSPIPLSLPSTLSSNLDVHQSRLDNELGKR